MARKILFETALTDIKDSDVEGIGILREDELGNVYRWVENTSGTAMAAGSACAYPATDGSASPALFRKRISAQAAAELSADCFAGIAMAAIAASGASTSKYGWIQVQGVHSAASASLKSSAVALVIGDVMVPNTDALALDRLVTSAASADAHDTAKFNVAIAMQGLTSASASNTAVIAVNLHCI